MKATGLPMRVAGDVVALTFSIVRGFAIRRMIVDDSAEFERLIGPGEKWFDSMCRSIFGLINGTRLTRRPFSQARRLHFCGQNIGASLAAMPSIAGHRTR